MQLTFNRRNDDIGEPTQFEFLNKFLDKYASENWFEYKPKIYAFMSVFLVDMFCSLLLYGSISNWEATRWSIPNFFRGLISFNTSTSDMIILSLMRTFVVPSFVVLGVMIGSRNTDEFKNSDNDNDSLFPADEKSSSSKDKSNVLPNITGASDRIEGDKKGEGKSKEDRDEMLSFRKKFIVGFVFAILTLCQIVIGIKAVLISFPKNAGFSYVFSGLLMGSLVLVMNIELWLANDLISGLTAEIGKEFSYFFFS